MSLPHLTRIATISLLCLGLFGTAPALAENARDLEILGWVEKVKLQPEGAVIRAKLDTGADNSSLHAPDPEPFERDGDEWVRFTVEDYDGNTHEFEMPIERTVRIRSASGVERRHVVKMEVCIAGIQRNVDVNLADRSKLDSAMLIGRSYLKGHILVDSGLKYTVEPACDDSSDD